MCIRDSPPSLPRSVSLSCSATPHSLSLGGDSGRVCEGEETDPRREQVGAGERQRQRQSQRQRQRQRRERVVI
eukprot:1755241-Rhodomonas_salina.2